MNHKKNITKKNPDFLKYVLKLNGDIELKTAFEISLKSINNIDITKLKRIGLKTYQSRKWSVNEILQHLIDWERIWCYRAIIFARNLENIPEALDQEIMAKNSNANELSIEQLINELKILRQSTIMLFKTFNKAVLKTNCIFFEYEISLYDIGLTITAHQIHHFNIIKERYFPLDQ